MCVVQPAGFVCFRVFVSFLSICQHCAMSSSTGEERPAAEWWRAAADLDLPCLQQLVSWSRGGARELQPAEI